MISDCKVDDERLRSGDINEDVSWSKMGVSVELSSGTASDDKSDSNCGDVRSIELSSGTANDDKSDSNCGDVRSIELSSGTDKSDSNCGDVRSIELSSGTANDDKSDSSCGDEISIELSPGTSTDDESICGSDSVLLKFNGSKEYGLLFSEDLFKTRFFRFFFVLLLEGNTFKAKGCCGKLPRGSLCVRVSDFDLYGL